MAFNRIPLSELKDRLEERCGNNSTFWTDPERSDAINEAVCVWQLATGATVVKAQIPITGDTFYPIPKQIMSVLTVGYDSTRGAGGTTVEVLPMTSLPELDYGFSGWEGAAGAPQMWAPNGLNELALYPTPTSGVLVVTGIAENVRLNDSDFLDGSDDEAVPMVAYGHHYATFKEAGAEQQASLEDVKEFFSAAGERNGKLRVTAFYRRSMGLQRDEGERPARSAGELGVRT